MTVPMCVTVNCLLETGKAYPVTEKYSTEDYVLDSMAFNFGKQVVTSLPIVVTPSETTLPTGQPASYNYSTTAYVFTKEELDTFVSEVKQAVKYDMQAMKLLQNFQGAVN